MTRQRREFSADWKAKVALEAIKGQRTIQEIASHYEVHPNLVTQWRKQLLDGAAQVFSTLVTDGSGFTGVHRHGLQVADESAMLGPSILKEGAGNGCKRIN